MADQQEPVQEQYNTVYTLSVQPGIKRDGTKFETREYSDGTWCRFQRGVPKKMGGYRTLFTSLNGIARGMIANATSGVNYIFSGTNSNLQVFTTGTTLGLGSGPFVVPLNIGYAPLGILSNTTSEFVLTGDKTGVFTAGKEITFAASTNPTVYTVGTSTYNIGTLQTTVTFTPTLPAMTTVENVWLVNAAFQPDPRLLWQFDMQYSPGGGALKVLAHPGLNLRHIDNGIASQVYYGNMLPDANNQWSFIALSDSTGQNPTYQPITVDGGVCVLYPFIFVYGSNGYIANNNVDSTYADQTPTDWNGPLANQVNMSSAKIVKGMPTRGGTNSPSGLFWATDSLIRVSFTGSAPYWRYDIVSSQISIMSSSSVVEMDGLFYWMGVDRFYVYNGQVNVLDNDKNVNWLFDNLNFEQRQKVWATKVPRYNEIWFFYPRGLNTECSDAIIYNVKDKIWYDAGSADGARRSCGYTTEIFPTPIWSGWEYNPEYTQAAIIIENPESLDPPEANQFYLSGDQTPVYSPGKYLTFSQAEGAPIYLITESIFTINSTIGAPGVTLVTVSENFDTAPVAGEVVYVVFGGYTMWQHEFGRNKVTTNDEFSILSNFTTCDISWVGGNPSQDTNQGVNRRLHMRRVEPDFVQTGNMSLTIVGRKFARGEDSESGPFYFDPDTGKIDMRVEHREAKLKFESDDIDGNFELGRILLTIEYGDERP